MTSDHRAGRSDVFIAEASQRASVALLKRPEPLTLSLTPPASDRASRPGEYSGYGDAGFDSYERSSVLVAMRDGVRVAIDVFRPVRSGRPAGPMPALLKVHRYGRAWLDAAGTLTHALADTVRPPTMVGAGQAAPGRPNVLRALSRHGYVIAVMDVRGGGASFGSYAGPQSVEETADTAEVIAWLARHPWCDGNVGMVGRSYAGSAQIMAASEAPPALKAIFPGVNPFDLHMTLMGGGIYRSGLLESWKLLIDTRDGLAEAAGPVIAPVDEDPEGVLRDAAVAEHAGEPGMVRFMAAVAANSDNLRDFTAYRAAPRQGHVNAATRLHAMQAAAIPMYQFSGWMDFAVDAALVQFASWHGPRKLMVGPWTHSPDEPDDPREDESVRLEAIEARRWFDYWLKGVDNGIMDEPPIHYALMGAGKTWAWRSATTWPPADCGAHALFAGPGHSGSVASLNDGTLEETPPKNAEADDWLIDYGTSSGHLCTRWTEAGGVGPIAYPDMTANDRKCLTYTTAPLTEPLAIVGSPVLRLPITATAPDLDVFAWLERILPDGRSAYLTEGQLRASHRTLGVPPYETFGLPWPSSDARDVAQTPPLDSDEPAELVFALMPTGAMIAAGERLRLAIGGYDDGNMATPKRQPPPRVRVMLGGEVPTTLTLSVLPS